MFSMPGAVDSFLFATSFFTFSKVMLNSLTRLTFSFSCPLISSIHNIYGVLSTLSLSLSLSLSLLDTSPKLDKLFHFWHLSFVCFLTFQHSKESFLVPLEHYIILLPFPFFFTFCWLYLFVPQLVQPLLSGIPQIVISCIFINQDSQFLDDLLLFLSYFSLLYPSIQFIARFCYNLARFFGFLL